MPVQQNVETSSLPKDTSSLQLHNYRADWHAREHYVRRLLSEFLGTFGFVFSISMSASIFHAYARPEMPNYLTVLVLTMVSAMWLVIAIWAFGDVSAHFNPAVTFAFALRKDMSWASAAAYGAVQCISAAAASLLARLFFGTSSGLGTVQPQPGQSGQAVIFEALLTAAFVLLVLSMSQGPKLNQPFTPLAVGAFVLSFGTVGGLYDGAAFNPARAFGPDLAMGHLGTWWVYVLGAAIGATLAVSIDAFLRASTAGGPRV